MFALIKIFIVFILVIFLTRRLALGISLFIGTIFIGLLFGFEISGWIDLVASTLSTSDLWRLFFIFFALGIFASSMEISGALDELIDNLQMIIKNSKIITAITPMLIGMVNIPGGAYISAPFVDKAAWKLGLQQEEKSAINIIFRHFWYPVYPIFPAIILLHDLSKVPISRIITFGIPGVVISFCMSWWICFGKVKNGSKYSLMATEQSFYALKKVIRSLLPLVLMVSLVLILKLNVLHAIMSSILSLILLFYNNFSSSFKEVLLKICYKGIHLKILTIPFGIYFFRNALNKSQAIESLPVLIDGINISVLFPTIVFSALIAFFTAYHLAAISISAPVLLPLFSPEIYDIGVFLILAGTIIGYLVSPLHTCIALSNDYFNVSYVETIGKVIFSAMGIIIGSILSTCIFFM